MTIEQIIEQVVRRVVREELATMSRSAPAHGETLTCKQAAARLGISQITLYQWRSRAEGPAFFKVGRNVRYRAGDVDDWLSKRRIGK